MAHNRRLFTTSLTVCLKKVETYAEAKTPNVKLFAEIQYRYGELTAIDKELFRNHLVDKMQPYREELRANHYHILENFKSNIGLPPFIISIVTLALSKLSQGITGQEYSNLNNASGIAALTSTLLMYAYDRYYEIFDTLNRKRDDATLNNLESCPYSAILKAAYAHAPDSVDYTCLSYDC